MCRGIGGYVEGRCGESMGVELKFGDGRIRWGRSRSKLE